MGQSHLEFSETNCPDAQSQLGEIIGARAASDCIQLWRSSHATASAAKSKTLSQASSQSFPISSTQVLER
jgi:hypothetical protein